MLAAALLCTEYGNYFTPGNAKSLVLFSGVSQSRGIEVSNNPNPFNESTKIRFQLTEDAFVSLHVFDLYGKEVITLLNGPQLNGGVETTLEGEALRAGVYEYRLVTVSISRSGKLDLIT